MKGDFTPKEFHLGECYLCMKPCDNQSYCHNECAIAYSD